MGIAGIGIDIVSVERIKGIIARWGERFLTKVFSGEEELSRVESIAGRFAAKEAVLKVLKTGWGGGVGWKDVWIIGGGEPKVVLRNRALMVARRLSIKRIHLSVTHQSGLALAVAVGETTDE